jgi:hypothetical protein
MKNKAKMPRDLVKKTDKELLGDLAVNTLNDVFSKTKNLSELITKDRKKMFDDILRNKVSEREQEEIKNILGKELWDQYLEEAKNELEG